MTELAVWLLILGFNDGGHAVDRYALPMASMQECLQSVSAGKIDGAHAGDAQTVVAMACVRGDPKDRSDCYPAHGEFNGETWPCEHKELHKP